MSEFDYRYDGCKCIVICPVHKATLLMIRMLRVLYGRNIINRPIREAIGELLDKTTGYR